MLNTFKVLALTSAAAAVIGGASTAQAAEPTADQARSIEAKARAHITSFPGYTLHDKDQTHALRSAFVDEDGDQYARFDRSYRGMPVIGGDQIVHSDRNGNFRETSMTMSRGINVARSATVSADRAIRAALNKHAGKTDGTKPTAVIYARGDSPVLAWDVRVYSQQAERRAQSTLSLTRVQAPCWMPGTTSTPSQQSARAHRRTTAT